MGLQLEHWSLHAPTERVSVFLEVYSQYLYLLKLIFELVLKLQFLFSVQSGTTDRAKSKYTTADVIPISNLININATSGYAFVHTKLSWRTNTAFENLLVPNCLSFLGQSKFLSELEGGERAKQSVAVGCGFWQFLDHCDAEGLVLLRLGWGGGRERRRARAEHLIFTGRGEKHDWRQFSAEGHTS